MATLLAAGRNVRVDAQRATVEDFPEFQKMNPQKAENKLALLRAGDNTKAENCAMPSNRPFQDAIWIISFLVTACFLFGWGYIRSGALLSKINEAASSVTTTSAPTHADDTDLTSKQVLVTLVVATCSSMMACLVFVFMAHRQPACVVWSSLICGPCLFLVMGIGALAGGEAICGLLCIAGGVIGLFVNLFCYRHLIPFMVQVTEVVADVIRDHPCMMMVGFIGTSIGFLWVVMMGLAFASIYVDMKESRGVELDEGNFRYISVFGSSLIFLWGLGIASNICHVTYCGVFGHWYYKSNATATDAHTHENTLTPALKVSLTTSLGSICLGSLLVAIIRALEKVARQLMNDAKAEGNPVTCVIGCILMSVISCIGDILEYFNDWAFVQCAVRGVSFMDAATITFSLMTCANMKYIISDLLLSSVVTFGTLLVAAIATSVTAGLAATLYGMEAAAVGGVLGFFIGLVAGGAALGVIDSGVKTLLACWADNPEPLRQTHPEIHNKFMEKLGNILGADSDVGRW